MPQFKFNTISRADIERSRGGNAMLHAIDFDGDANQLVTGVPGSGKTTVTIMRAERLLHLGKKIKVFTFQNLLKLSLQNSASQQLQNHIHGFYQWYSSNFSFLNSEDTEVSMLIKMSNLMKFDEILIDEGQDFEERIFRCLLNKSSQLTVGADNSQKLHERGIQSDIIKSELEKVKRTIPIRLDYNYRNTFENYNFARHFLQNNERVNNPISLDLIPKGTGNKPVVIQVLSEIENEKRLRIILENAGDRNIAVLLYHQSDVDSYYNTILRLGFNCTKHHNRSQTNSMIENILVTTFKSAKGLEFQVVIMPEMHLAMDTLEKTAEHYYVGCTRAKESLFILYRGANLPTYFNEFPQDCYEHRGSENIVPQIRNISNDLPF